MSWAWALLGVSVLLGAIATLMESRKGRHEHLRLNAPSRGSSHYLNALAIGPIVFGSGLAHDAGHSRVLYAVIGLGSHFVMRACLIALHNRRVERARPT